MVCPAALIPSPAAPAIFQFKNPILEAYHNRSTKAAILKVFALSAIIGNYHQKLPYNMSIQPQEAVDYFQCSSIDLLRNEVRTQRQERIPVASIVKEGALIDLDHARNLAESMMGDREQISPATVRARIAENDQIVYDVIDGFHRAEGKRIIEDITHTPQTLDTIVVYGCEDEELFDLRVLAASSVRSIKFARMAEWMKRSFISTKWQNLRIHELVDREEITLSQVFSLTQFDSSGSHLHLGTEEVIELKGWAVKKAKQWGRPISTLMTEMRTVELAAPDLVQMVRTGGGGRDGKGVLTKARLESIVTNLPGDWETQRKFVDLAIQKNILAEDLDLLTWSYANAKESGDFATMEKILTEPEFLLGDSSAQSLPTKRKAMTEPSEHVIILDREKYISAKKKRAHSTSNHKEKRSLMIDEYDILKKHHVSEIICALTEVILTNQNHNVTILNIPGGEVKLDLGQGVLKLNDKSVPLTARETEMMLTFSLLEGVKISSKIFELISVFEANESTKEAFLSLKEKMSQLSKKAATELRLNQNEYSWLEN